MLSYSLCWYVFIFTHRPPHLFLPQPSLFRRDGLITCQRPSASSLPSVSPVFLNSISVNSSHHIPSLPLPFSLIPQATRRILGHRSLPSSLTSPVLHWSTTDRGTRGSGFQLGSSFLCVQCVFISSFHVSFFFPKPVITSVSSFCSSLFVCLLTSWPKNNILFHFVDSPAVLCRRVPEHNHRPSHFLFNRDDSPPDLFSGILYFFLQLHFWKMLKITDTSHTPWTNPDFYDCLYIGHLKSLTFICLNQWLYDEHWCAAGVTWIQPIFIRLCY